ncbi:hypothetical protein [Rhodoferax ferrireducens]|uniref:hypothetical protein n=1 Tax=Rhodoferax ferrireducens TaxID=192843 RepID=UPI000E0D8185|nr:hypothetical protein [Rhodoferax ferrireducens]
MSLSSSTLTAIQKVGAAAFAADEKLQKEVKEYAERVQAAIAKNAYSLGNDVLIENWKVVARLAQSLVGIEEELRKIYQVASELTDDERPLVREVPVLEAPTWSASRGVTKQVQVKPAKGKLAPKKRASKLVTAVVATAKRSAKLTLVSDADLTPTDVVVKRSKKVASSKAKVNKSSGAAFAEKKAAALGGNPTKLLAHFERVLNSNDFTALSQTVAAQETGIPLGSMTAAVKKLIETGRIVSGPDGGLKLATAQPASQSASQPPLEA